MAETCPAEFEVGDANVIHPPTRMLAGLQEIIADEYIYFEFVTALSIKAGIAIFD